MPRGKNYVNNNKGMTMQSSTKKKAPSMEQCFYGAGCTRANCIYRHDAPKNGENENGSKSNDPCMPFLAGSCTFSAQGCKKRHPSKQEADILRAKYQQTKCRYGNQCKTNGCLYIHPGDEGAANGGALDHSAAFPPLAGAGAPLRSSLTASAWKPSQPTGASLAVNTAPVTTTTATTATNRSAPAAWTPPAQPQTNSIKNVWGQPIPNSVTSPNSAAPTAITTTTTTTANPIISTNTAAPAPLPAPTTPRSFAAAAAAGAAKDLEKTTTNNNPTPPLTTTSPETLVESQQPRSSDTLNIHAKEFVPGVGFSC